MLFPCLEKAECVPSKMLVQEDKGGEELQRHLMYFDFIFGHSLLSSFSSIEPDAKRL